MYQYKDDEWQKLYIDWRKERPEYDKFVEDGIMCPSIWQERSKTGRRVLFILKEYNCNGMEANGEIWRLQDLTLSNDFKAPIWRRVAEWMKGIDDVQMNGPIPPYVALDNTVEKYPEILLQLKKIAVINLKKDAGGSSSRYEEISHAAKEDHENIGRELQLIDPDIIICGGTSEYLMTHVYPSIFGEAKNWKETLRKPMWEQGYCFANLEQRERLIVDYYHPACQYPKKMTYYALVGLYQTAIRDKYRGEA